MTPSARWLTMSAALFAVSCANLEKGAREDFANRNACPLDRVASKPRPDIPISKARRADTPKQPPDDVAADPGRLAKWNEDRAKEKAADASFDSRYSVFEVRGCNKTEVLVCKSGPSVFCSASKVQ